MVLLKRFNTEFSKNVFKLTFGTVLAQAIPFLMLPVLQKWFYSVSDFGILTHFTSIAAIVTSFASLKYEYAIVLAKDRIQQYNLTFLSLFFTFAISILLLIIALVIPGPISELFKAPEAKPYLWLVPVSIIGFGGTQVFQYWYNKEKSYSFIAWSKFVQSFVGETAKVGGYYPFPGPAGLIVGRVAGQVASFIWMLKRMLNKEKEFFSSITFSRLKGVFNEYKSFALFTTPGSFLGVLTSNIHILILTGIYGLETVGYIGISFIYIGMPLGIIASSFSQVFYQKISEIKSKKEMFRAYRNNAAMLFSVGLLASVVIHLIPSKWIEQSLGAEWTEILVYLKILILYLMVSFVSSALSFIYIRLGKQKVVLFFDFIHLGMIYLSIIGGHALYNNPVDTMKLFALAQLIFYTFTISLAFYLIKTSKILQ